MHSVNPFHAHHQMIHQAYTETGGEDVGRTANLITQRAREQRHQSFRAYIRGHSVPQIVDQMKDFADVASEAKEHHLPPQHIAELVELVKRELH